jgi:methylated-DNA-[protein]-cysteine S-methyltransferase
MPNISASANNKLYYSLYPTPSAYNDIIMISDGCSLTGLHFIGAKEKTKYLNNNQIPDLPIFIETRRWLDIYFSGHQPDFTPHYKIENPTSFRREISEIMCTIPFGKTLTYGEIAAQIAKKHGLEKMSAQAVGGAVGWNPICIIVPCHRVMGAGGKITGYGGGISNKIALLRLEGVNDTEIV